MSSSYTVLIVPHTSAYYDMTNVYFKDRAYRKISASINDTENEYASTQITYINNLTIMNGLTFLINSINGESSDYANRVEAELLKLYSETYVVGNKRAMYSIRNDISKMTLECNTWKKKSLYIFGIWESMVDYGLEYKWLEVTHQL